MVDVSEHSALLRTLTMGDPTSATVNGNTQAVDLNELLGDCQFERSKTHNNTEDA